MNHDDLGDDMVNGPKVATRMTYTIHLKTWDYIIISGLCAVYCGPFRQALPLVFSTLAVKAFPGPFSNFPGKLTAAHGYFLALMVASSTVKYLNGRCDLRLYIADGNYVFFWIDGLNIYVIYKGKLWNLIKQTCKNKMCQSNFNNFTSIPIT